MSTDVKGRLKIYIKSFVDNFETYLLVCYKTFQNTIKDSQYKPVINVEGDSINRPTKALENIVARLEDLMKKYDVNISNKPPTEEELLKWLNEANKRSNIDKRNVLILGCIEIFQSYEKQFMEINEEDIEKLAKEAAIKVIKYYAVISKVKSFDIKLISMAVFTDFDSHKGLIQLTWDKLFTNLMCKKLQIESKKPVKIMNTSEEVLLVDKFYTHVGILSDDGENFYKTKLSNSSKYGYRQYFSFEKTEKLCVDVEIEIKNSQQYKFILNQSSTETIIDDILKIFKERDFDAIEEDIKQKITFYKSIIEEEMKNIKKDFYLEVFEEMVEVMETVENVINIDKIKKEDNEDKKLQAASPGNKITNISRNKMNNWNSTIYQ